MCVCVCVCVCVCACMYVCFKSVCVCKPKGWSISWVRTKYTGVPGVVMGNFLGGLLAIIE